MDGHADDGAIVARARSGDQSAFAELVERHQAATWSICLRITGNRHDAEDALQNALTAAWLHLDRFRGDSRFGTWLYRVAANASLAVVRRRRREVTMDELPVVAFERDLAVEIAARDQIHAALAGLSPVFREALVLREIGDLTYQDIAAHQGVPVQTVKSRLSRARAALGQALSAGETV
jgi:RNA polymerase sigma-70 factor (ECF subfamily)